MRAIAAGMTAPPLRRRCSVRSSARWHQREPENHSPSSCSRRPKPVTQDLACSGGRTVSFRRSAMTAAGLMFHSQSCPPTQLTLHRHEFACQP